MNTRSFDDATPTEASRDAAAADAAAAWRLPRYLDLVAAAFAVHPRPPAAGSPHRVLVVEPGRGGLGRALADGLGPEDHVTTVAGTPEDAPPAPGGVMDDAFVERRPHAAALDMRAAAPAGWPLEPDEDGGFDTVVIGGGLAWLADPGRTLADARAAMSASGRLLVADDDPAALVMHPPVPLFEAAWRHRLTRRSMRGQDDALIRRLPELLDRHRLVAVGGGIASHGAISGEDEFPGVVRLLGAMLAGRDARDPDGPASATRAPAPRGRLSADDPGGGPDADQVGEALDRWSRLPGAVAWWPLPWVLAARA